jgi:flavin reductase (DIM6/NTAB) family NADH-FMN oxidoreductase RutF
MAAVQFACSITACTAMRVCSKRFLRCVRSISTEPSVDRVGAVGAIETAKQLPDASWRPGMNQKHPFPTQSWKEFDPAGPADAFSRYSLLISCVVPRPIALVTSINSLGDRNCAPFSYFNAVCHDPPLVAITVCTQGRDHVQKDTLNNIEQTNEFVVNIMSEWYIESANHTCGAFPPDVDEITLSGLTTLPSTKVKPERIAEAAIQMECQTYSITPIHNDAKEHTASMIIGRIVNFHVHEGVLSEGGATVDINKLRPMGRAGGNTYCTMGNTFDLARPPAVAVPPK